MRRSFSVGLVAVCVVASLSVAAEPSKIDGERAFVTLMHSDLNSVDTIISALLRDDYEQVRQRASMIAANTQILRDFDLASCGLDPARDAEFDGFADAQKQAAATLIESASRNDTASVLTGLQALTSSGCVGCHTVFLETDLDRTPRVLLMRNLLASVNAMTAAAVLNDFPLVAREAREISAVARVFEWSQVIEQLFMVTDAAEKESFRRHLEVLRSEAIRLEGAAVSAQPEAIADATRRMLELGCVACHSEFRR